MSKKERLIRHYRCRHKGCLGQVIVALAPTVYGYLANCDTCQRLHAVSYTHGERSDVPEKLQRIELWSGTHPEPGRPLSEVR